jgi:hypothetical protein
LQQTTSAFSKLEQFDFTHRKSNLGDCNNSFKASRVLRRIMAKRLIQNLEFLELGVQNLLPVTSTIRKLISTWSVSNVAKSPIAIVSNERLSFLQFVHQRTFPVLTACIIQ